MVERLYEPIPPLGQAQPAATAIGATAPLPERSADLSPPTAAQDAEAATGADTLEASHSDIAGAAAPSASAPEPLPSGQASLSLDLPVVPLPPAASVGASQASASVKPEAGASPAVASQSASSGLETAPKAPARPSARPSNTGLYVIILVGLIAFVWVTTRAPEPQAPAPVVDPAPQGSPAPGPAAPSENPAADTPAPTAPPATAPSSVGPPPATGPTVAPTPPAAPQTPAPAAAPPAKSSAPAAPGPTSAPTKAPPPPPPAVPPTPPAPSPAPPSSAPPAAPVAPAAPAPEGAAPKVPELELTFRTKGWVWVRESNDQVREFVVQEGGTVRFQEVPIFIVLPAPDQIDAKVLGRPVSLKRTEDEKNHGRFTRTMLRQAANLGRPTSSSAN